MYENLSLQRSYFNSSHAGNSPGIKREEMFWAIEELYYKT